MIDRYILFFICFKEWVRGVNRCEGLVFFG